MQWAHSRFCCILRKHSVDSLCSDDMLKSLVLSGPAVECSCGDAGPPPHILSSFAGVFYHHEEALISPLPSALTGAAGDILLPGGLGGGPAPRSAADARRHSRLRRAAVGRLRPQRRPAAALQVPALRL